MDADPQGHLSTGLGISKTTKVTQRQLVNKLGVSFRKIQKNMTEMVDCGEIIRIGSTRGGHWEVLK